MPRYLRCSYSVGDSISVNLIVNYPIGAFVGKEYIGCRRRFIVVGEVAEGDRLLHKESEMKQIETEWERKVTRVLEGKVNEGC